MAVSPAGPTEATLGWIVGKSEVKESLNRSDFNTDQTRWKVVHARVEWIFKEAEAGVKSPAIPGYKAVEQWKLHPGDDEAEEGLDLASRA